MRLGIGIEYTFQQAPRGGGNGDPLPTPVVTERGLRPLLKLPAEEQRHVLQAACARQGG
jgi:hypothetical protein